MSHGTDGRCPMLRLDVLFTFVSLRGPQLSQVSASRRCGRTWCMRRGLGPSWVRPVSCERLGDTARTAEGRQAAYAAKASLELDRDSVGEVGSVDVRGVAEVDGAVRRGCRYASSATSRLRRILTRVPDRHTHSPPRHCPSLQHRFYNRFNPPPSHRRPCSAFHLPPH